MRQIVKVRVDSWQIIIIGPCYLSECKHGNVKWVDDKFSGFDPVQDNDYGKVAYITSEGEGYGEHIGGVVAGCFGGDGEYPVMADFNEYGLIKSIIIDFSSNPLQGYGNQDGEDEEEMEEEEDEDLYCSNCGRYTGGHDYNICEV